MKPKTSSPESIVREIKKNTHRKFTAEEKIRIVLQGLKGEDCIAEICRREGIAPSLYYRPYEWTYVNPYRINNNSTVAGWGVEANDKQHYNQKAFIAVPK